MGYSSRPVRRCGLLEPARPSVWATRASQTVGVGYSSQPDHRCGLLEPANHTISPSFENKAKECGDAASSLTTPLQNLKVAVKTEPETVATD